MSIEILKKGLAEQSTKNEKPLKCEENQRLCEEFRIMSKNVYKVSQNKKLSGLILVAIYDKGGLSHFSLDF